MLSALVIILGLRVVGGALRNSNSPRREGPGPPAAVYAVLAEPILSKGVLMQPEPVVEWAALCGGMCVCVYLCAPTDVCAYECAPMCVYVNECAIMCMYVCVHAHMCLCLGMCAF